MLHLLVVVVPPLLDLHCCLAHGAGCTAKRTPDIPHGVPLNIVPLPGLLPQEEGGDARHDAAQQAVEQPALPHVLSCPVGQAGGAAHTTAANTHIPTTVKHTLLPLTSHPRVRVYLL